MPFTKRCAPLHCFAFPSTWFPQHVPHQPQLQNHEPQLLCSCCILVPPLHSSGLPFSNTVVCYSQLPPRFPTTHAQLSCCRCRSCRAPSTSSNPPNAFSCCSQLTLLLPHHPTTHASLSYSCCNRHLASATTLKTSQHTLLLSSTAPPVSTPPTPPLTHSCHTPVAAAAAPPSCPPPSLS